MQQLLLLILCVVLPFSSLAALTTLGDDFDEKGSAHATQIIKAHRAKNSEARAKDFLLMSLKDLVHSLRETSLTSRLKVWRYTTFQKLESLAWIQYLPIAELGLNDSLEKNNLRAVEVLRKLSSQTNQPFLDWKSPVSVVDKAVKILLARLNETQTTSDLRAAIMEALGDIPESAAAKYKVEEEIARFVDFTANVPRSPNEHLWRALSLLEGGRDISKLEQLTAIRVLGKSDHLSVPSQKTLSVVIYLWKVDEEVREAAIKALERTAEAGRLDSENIKSLEVFSGRIEPSDKVRAAMLAVLSKVQNSEGQNPPEQQNPVQAEKEGRELKWQKQKEQEHNRLSQGSAGSSNCEGTFS